MCEVKLLMWIIMTFYLKSSLIIIAHHRINAYQYLLILFGNNINLKNF